MIKPRRGSRLTPFRIVLIYALVGSLWILFSDMLASEISFDAHTFAVISILKGWLYVAITSLLLYWLVNRYSAGHQKTMEAEIAKEAAEAASRSKSEFLAHMSHELRTPLNSVIGFSEFLREGYAGTLTASQKGYAELIYESGHHMLSLINDILDLSKIEAGRLDLKIDKFPVRELISESLNMFMETAARRGIRINSDIDKAPEMIAGDKMRIKQILFNLIGNAMKFTPDGGSITVRARMTGTGFIEFSVTDTGIGIAAGDQQKLFQPFQQVDSSSMVGHTGTGLGLNICKNIVELHRGRIWLESEVGRGSTFSFTIPYPASEEA